MKTILVIEDNSEIRENVTEILELAQYNVLSAENGKDGVALAMKQTPDLVLCDIMMPVLDGYGVLHLFNKDSKLSSVPFIFVSAKASRDDFRKGMDLGADDYITKPFNQSELLNSIEARLRKSEILKSDYNQDAEGIKRFMAEVKNNAKVNLTSPDNEVQAYKKKAQIYTEGHRPMYLYFVNKGKVKTYRVNTDGKELITGLYTAGDFFGYTALLEEAMYSDNAEVLEEADIMMIPKADFASIVNSENQIVKKFFQLLSHNLVEKENQLINLAYNSLRKRVANGVLQVYDKYKQSTTDKPGIKMSRENLAQLIGTPTESLCRILSDFREEKMIDIKEGKIEVLQENKLKDLRN